MSDTRSGLAPSPLRGRTILHLTPFTEDWCERAFRVIDTLAAESGLVPQIILPHDIHLEDYEPRYEVCWGAAAGAALQAAAAPGAPHRLLVWDLSPLPLPEVLLPKLDGCLAATARSGSSLLVLTPALQGLNINGFDVLYQAPGNPRQAPGN